MNSQIKRLVRSGLLLGIAIVFQFIGKSLLLPQVSQYLVGSMVNATLILATALCGIWWGVAISCLTPLTAYLVGQLSSAMLPFVPFIIGGNIVFVVVFGILNKYIKRGMVTGYILGAFLKFLFMYFTSRLFVKVIAVDLPDKIAKTLVVMMGFPQLITALIGGALAIFVVKFMLKNYNESY